jgi:hypothetical protein
MTFDRRAGVCRDKAALLVAMLRMAEFDAYPVIIMSGPKKDPDVPQPFFNHAITCVKKEDGAYVLMDPTDESTKQFLPAYLGNCSYLVATPEGETLRVSPVEPAERNMMHIRTKAALDRSGGFNAESVLTFEGINDNMYRGYFSRLSSDERRGYFERIIRKFMPAALLSDYEISPANILDTNNPLKVRLSFEAKNILISGESIVMVPMPLMGKSIGMVSYLTKETGLEKRKYPLFAGYACGFDETFELDTEQSVGRPASLPEYENIENGEFTWNRSTSFEKGSLVGRNIFKMKLPEYSPEEYSSLKEILEKTEYEDRKMPIFSKPSESDEDTWCSSFGTDAVILNETDEYDIENAGNWTETKHVKMKILTYAGKKDNGDIYINYNPVWEDVKILKASVTSSSGNTKTVRDEEINEMDAGWAGYAPRYPAAKTLVVSLPGVEKGSVIEYTIERKKKDRLFFYANEDIIKKWTEAPENHAFFSVDGIFSYYYPILKKTIRIRAPANLDLKIFKSDTGIGPEMTDNPGLNNIIKEKVEKAGKFTIHEFTARKVPPVKNEGYLPPWYGFNPLVTASAGDWKRYVREVEKALLRAASSQPRAEAKAKEITGDIKGDTARITAIRDFAAKNIRPVDIELGDMPMGYITPADRTLADGYGNSADRAVLLYSLLSAAGYSPEFVLLSESSRVPSLQELVRRYPAPCLFQYVLVRVETDKGYIYLNDTDQYARLGSTPNRGYPVLILKSGETKTVDISGADLKDKTCTSFSITLSGDGDAIIKRTRKVYGMDFASFHRQFAEMTPEELKRHNQELVASVSQSAVPHGEYLVDYDVYPGIEEFSVKVKNYAILQDDYLYMKLPGIASGIRGTESGSRENPLYRDLAIKDFTNIEVVMPANAYSIRIKPAGSFLFEFGEYGRISIKSDVSYIKPMCLNVRQDIDIDPVIVASEDYPRFLEASRILGRPETEMLVLKMKKVGTPVP